MHRLRIPIPTQLEELKQIRMNADAFINHINTCEACLAGPSCDVAIDMYEVVKVGSARLIVLGVPLDYNP